MIALFRHITSVTEFPLLTCRVVCKLFFVLDRPHQDASTVKAACYSDKFLAEVVVTSTVVSSYSYLQQNNLSCLPAPFNMCGQRYSEQKGAALSRIVNLLTQSLLMSASKFLTVSNSTYVVSTAGY